jgi:hypothetical protein
MKATKELSPEKLAIKAAKAHHKQFMVKHPDRAREEKLSLQSYLINSMKNAKSQVRFAIL